MSTIPVYSIVAYSNTGKTTMLEKLIPELKRRGLRVAVIKHDAHEFDIDHKGKDSWRITQAGAEMTVISSQTKAAIIENRYVSIEELISKINDVDIIITEGYKHGPWPKIALRRAENKKPFPVPPEECLAVMSDLPEVTNTPSLKLDDVENLADLIEKDIKSKHREL